MTRRGWRSVKVAGKMASLRRATRSWGKAIGRSGIRRGKWKMAERSERESTYFVNRSKRGKFSAKNKLRAGSPRRTKPLRKRTCFVASRIALENYQITITSERLFRWPPTIGKTTKARERIRVNKDEGESARKGRERLGRPRAWPRNGERPAGTRVKTFMIAVNKVTQPERCTSGGVVTSGTTGSGARKRHAPRSRRDTSRAEADAERASARGGWRAARQRGERGTGRERLRVTVERRRTR